MTRDEIFSDLLDALRAGLGDDAPDEFSPDVLAWGHAWLDHETRHSAMLADDGAKVFADLLWLLPLAVNLLAEKLRRTGRPVVVTTGFLQNVAAVLQVDPTRLC